MVNLTVYHCSDTHDLMLNKMASKEACEEWHLSKDLKKLTESYFQHTPDWVKMQTEVSGKSGEVSVQK